jgi:hypothetical protein
MSARLLIAAAALLAGTASAARADVFVAGPLYQGNPATTEAVNCRLFNYGTADVAIRAARIYDNVGRPAEIVNGCSPTLAPRRSCAVTAFTRGANLAYSCMINTGDPATLSGSLEMQNDNDEVLFVLPLLRQP